MFAVGSASLGPARCGQSIEGENTTISRCKSVFLCVVDVFDVMIDCRPQVGLQPGAGLETYPRRGPIARRDAWDNACFSCSAVQRGAVVLHVVWKRRGWAQPVSPEWLRRAPRVLLGRVSAGVDTVLTRRRLLYETRFDDTNNKHATCVAMRACLGPSPGRQLYRLLAVECARHPRANGSERVPCGLSCQHHASIVDFPSQHVLSVQGGTIKGPDCAGMYRCSS
jgi:hypothetical protein